MVVVLFFCLQLVQKMNINFTRKETKEKMDHYTGGRGEIDFLKFVKFMDGLMRDRRGIYAYVCIHT